MREVIAVSPLIVVSPKTILKIKEKGRYYELPIVGLKIAGIYYNGRLQVVFDDLEGSSLSIDGLFKVTHYNQTKEFGPASKEALTALYDVFAVPINAAIADKGGICSWYLRIPLN